MFLDFEERHLGKIIKELDRIENEDVSIIDAIVHYAETNDMEIESLAELLMKSAPMVSRIRQSAEKANLMEKSLALF